MHRLRPAPEIAAEIRRIRTKRSETQAAFAKAAGTSQPRLSAWENATDGYDYEPATLVKIAKLGGVPVSVFYEEEKGPTPLTALDIARLRDQVQEAAERMGVVLAELNGALGVSAPESPMEKVVAQGQEGVRTVERTEGKDTGAGTIPADRPRPSTGRRGRTPRPGT